MNEPALRLRGHHLLCALGFRGRGYDPAFVQNMDGIVRRLRSHPEMELELIDRCDEICSACPRMEQGRCAAREDSEQNIQRADQAVLARLGLAPGQRLSAAAIYALLGSAIKPDELGKSLCTNCQWLELGFCAEGLRQLQQGAFFDG